MFLKFISIILILTACTKSVDKELKEPIVAVIDSKVIDEEVKNSKTIKKEIHPDAPIGIFIQNPVKDIILAEINTSLGIMVFELYPNRAPLATENFINLSKKGFYNGNLFFRLVQDFIIQSGDKSNTGYADAGYYFKTERHPDLSHDRKGILSYANHDSETNSSQFFITLSSQTQLDDRHPVFGMMIRGQDVLEKMNEMPVDNRNRPVNKIKINSVKIIRN